MKNTLICLLLIVANLSLFSQPFPVDTTGNFKAKRYIKLSKKNLKRGNVYATNDILEFVLRNDQQQYNAAYQLAESYVLSRDYKKAEYWFEHVYRNSPAQFPLAQYYTALMMKMNGKYAQADNLFSLFIKDYNLEDITYKNWAEIDKKGCEIALSHMEKNSPFTILHLDSTVNSHYSDLAPVVWQDSLLLFASLPTDTVIVINDVSVPTDHFIKFYSATIKENEQYSPAVIFNLFNEKGYHTANGALSPDKQRFYFTKCADGKNGQIFCKILVSTYKNGKWQEPTELPYTVNAPQSTNTHPFVAATPKGEMLFFISNREGGQGGLDIWYSNISKSLTYSAPVNAGPKINTDRNEATPWYDATSATLYFSSEGFPGWGGYDVFKSRGYGKEWQDFPVNIGPPINSSTDEMYYHPVSAEKGYFVSNRPGIISIRGETCCDDIFEYFLPTPIQVAVQGYVYDSKDTVKKFPLDGSLVKLYLRNMQGVTGAIEAGIDTSGKGKMYFFPLETGNDYAVDGQTRGYFASEREVFTTKGIKKSDTLRVDLFVNKIEKNKAYRLRNIYYDFDKWNLRDISKLTLDTLFDLMTSNPLIIVEIGSHTDTRGTDAYNIQLSKRRAESCVNYLISQGIPPQRLQAAGYGETRLLDDCTKYDDCPEDNSKDCPCHQNNRRTEFMIIGELDAPLEYTDKRYKK